MTWIFLAVLSAVFLGLYGVGKKAAVQDNAVLPVLFACSASGLAMLLPVLALSALAPEVARQHGLLLQTLTQHQHLLVLAKAAIVTLSWVLTYHLAGSCLRFSYWHTESQSGA